MLGRRLKPQYITVSGGSEAARGTAGLARSIMLLVALCMVVVTVAAAYSVADHLGRARGETPPDDYAEVDTVKRQYLVPSAALPESVAAMRPEGYGERIGAALASQLARGGSARFDVVIDASGLAEEFDKSYPLCEVDGYTVYWSEMTAYQKYLADVGDVKEQRRLGNLTAEETAGRISLLRDEYGMAMLDRRTALERWRRERLDGFDEKYSRIADGKYLARLSASEIEELAAAGFRLLGVGDERADIDEKYEAYMSDQRMPLLWYLSRGDTETVEVEYMLPIGGGLGEHREEAASEIQERLGKLGLGDSVVGGSVHAVWVNDGSEGFTAAVCRLSLTKEETVRLLEGQEDECVGLVFPDDELYAEYCFAVYGDGFTYRTELIRADSTERSA